MSESGLATGRVGASIAELYRKSLLAAAYVEPGAAWSERHVATGSSEVARARVRADVARVEPGCACDS